MAKKLQNRVPETESTSGADSRRKSSTSDPEMLIADLNKSHMIRMFMYAILIHVIVTVATSLGFISLCVKHHSLHPRKVIEKIEKEAAEKKAKEDAAKAAEEAAKLAKAAAEDLKKNPKPAVKEPAREASAPAEGADAPPANEKKKSKIEQEIEKTSSERPTSPTIGLDITPDLE